MSEAEKFILCDSKEAANIQTVTGWVSRVGRFWGSDERIARYDGSTHKVCECGEIVSNRSYCKKCADRKGHEKYLAMPKIEWDRVTPLHLHGTDVYFTKVREAPEFSPGSRARTP